MGMDHWLDLHMHSNISNDGELSPEQLILRCSHENLKTVALTDHNSVYGIKKAEVMAKNCQLMLIPGIELDCQYKGHNLHLLGYGIDADAEIFTKIEASVAEQERKASATYIELIKKLGIEFDVSQALALAVNGVVTAEVIVEVALADSRNHGNLLLAPYRSGGSRSDNPSVNFYWDFCSQGKVAYVAMQFMDLQEAIQTVQGTGGVTVLAHPGANIGLDEKLTEHIINEGIDGIEVYSSYHDAKTIAFYQKKCDKYDLLVTIGSDFHGKTKPAIHLGKMGIKNEADLLYRLLTAINDSRERNKTI
jgi:predicted metal-dependent phosphoesterase TrpH